MTTMTEDEAEPYRESGHAAVRSNINAALGVASVVAKTLGPRGLDRLLVDSDGNFVVTNDGASLLACLEIEHPVGILMSELSQAQDDAVGDGTSSVVILAGELLRGAGTQLDRGVHPHTLIRGLEAARDGH